MAKGVGFQNIYSASGNVNNLKEIILQNFDSSKGKFLYVSGELISNVLDQQLISEEYNVKRIINFKRILNILFENFFKEWMR